MRSLDPQPPQIPSRQGHLLRLPQLSCRSLRTPQRWNTRPRLKPNQIPARCNNCCCASHPMDDWKRARLRLQLHMALGDCSLVSSAQRHGTRANCLILARHHAETRTMSLVHLKWNILLWGHSREIFHQERACRLERIGRHCSKLGCVLRRFLSQPVGCGLLSRRRLGHGMGTWGEVCEGSGG